jgi:hypothetical protein
VHPEKLTPRFIKEERFFRDEANSDIAESLIEVPSKSRLSLAKDERLFIEEDNIVISVSQSGYLKSR